MSDKGLATKRRLTYSKLFLLSFGVTLVISLFLKVLFDPRLPSRSPRPELPRLVAVDGHTYITSQLQPEDIAHLRAKGFRILVDIRPDGEAPHQPTSSMLGTIAENNRIDFFYIPVPHDTIPEEAVQKLQAALATQPTEAAVLFCRSGRRAVRLFALVEAMRPNGPARDDILQMVHDAGFSADDLKDDITRRIAGRSNSDTAKP